MFDRIKERLHRDIFREDPGNRSLFARERELRIAQTSYGRKARVVFGGDFLCADIALYCDEVVTANRMASVFETSEMLLDIDARYQPEVIVMHTLFRDMYNGANIKSLKDDLLRLAKRVREIPTVQQFVWMETVPLGPKYADEMFRAEDINSDLVPLLCPDRIIDTKWMKAEDGFRKPEFLARDQITLNAVGYRTLFQYIKELQYW